MSKSSTDKATQLTNLGLGRTRYGRNVCHPQSLFGHVIVYNNSRLYSIFPFPRYLVSKDSGLLWPERGNVCPALNHSRLFVGPHCPPSAGRIAKTDKKASAGDKTKSSVTFDSNDELPEIKDVDVDAMDTDGDDDDE